MRSLNTWPRLLLNLPYIIRLIISILAVLLFLMFYMLIPAGTRNPSIFVIPIALAAWMFKRRGMFICLVVIIGVLWVYYAFRVHSPFLSLNLTEIFIAGTVALLVVGLLIASQREALEMSEEAQQEMAAACAQQQQLNQAKDQLLLNLNHELRTPLTAIHGYLELLIAQGDVLDAEIREYFLKSAMYGCEELQVLINNVLDATLAGKEKEPLVMGEVAVMGVVEEVLMALDPRKTWRQGLVRLDIPEQLKVWANEAYVRQVLRNLVSNALKYCPAGTPVAISAAPASASASEVCICVQDAGPGISADEMPQLFGKFVRLKRDISGPVRGIGLGLYISKQLVEAMGGRIWVESAGIPGQGSRFYFTLPASCATPDLAPQNASLTVVPVSHDKLD